MAITSARRVSELAALRCLLPYLVFFPHSIHLCPNVRFLPKVVFDFHMLADIVLSDFYPDPTMGAERLLHTLDIKRMLLFYLNQTSFPNRAQNLFVAYSSPHQGEPVTSQTLSCWVTDTIELAYCLEKLPKPQKLTAHSTRAMASSVAFLDGVLLQEICMAATWSSPTTFIRHYAIYVWAKKGIPLARVVLSTVSG